MAERWYPRIPLRQPVYVHQCVDRACLYEKCACGTWVVLVSTHAS